MAVLGRHIFPVSGECYVGMMGLSVPSKVGVSGISHAVFVGSTAGVLSTFLPVGGCAMNIPFETYFVELIFPVHLQPIAAVVLRF